jgi:hypothetical protein
MAGELGKTIEDSHFILIFLVKRVSFGALFIYIKKVKNESFNIRCWQYIVG